MAKQNAMLAKIEKKYKDYYENLFFQKMDILGQMAMDAAMIGLDDMIGLGEVRSARFAEKYQAAFNEMNRLINSDFKEDKDLSFTKETVDRRLKKICGSKFVPWDVRYK